MACRSCEANADLLVKYTRLKRDSDELLVFFQAIHGVVSSGQGPWSARTTLQRVAELKEKYDGLTAEREDVFL